MPSVLQTYFNRLRFYLNQLKFIHSFNRLKDMFNQLKKWHNSRFVLNLKLHQPLYSV